MTSTFYIPLHCICSACSCDPRCPCVSTYHSFIMNLFHIGCPSRNSVLRTCHVCCPNRNSKLHICSQLCHRPGSSLFCTAQHCPDPNALCKPTCIQYKPAYIPYNPTCMPYNYISQLHELYFVPLYLNDILPSRYGQLNVCQLSSCQLRASNPFINPFH